MKSNRCFKHIMKTVLITACLAGISSAVAHADYLVSYDLEMLPSSYLMMGGNNYTITVTAKNELDEVYLGVHYITFTFPQGVHISGSLPKAIKGSATFFISVDDTAIPGPGQPITVSKASDSNIKATVNVTIERPIRQFHIQKLITPNTAGEEFTIVITAWDAFANLIRGFNGNVIVSESIGDDHKKLIVTAGGNGLQTINGSSFIDGVATVSMEVYATHPVSRTNTITFRTESQYCGSWGQKDEPFEINANKYHHVLFIMPSEIHLPGTLKGKQGVPDSKIAGVPFSNLLVVYLVDYWNNPIMSNDPAVTIPPLVTVAFSDTLSQPADVLPPPKIFNAENKWSVANPTTLTQAGEHVISAVGTGADNTSDAYESNKVKILIYHGNITRYVIDPLNPHQDTEQQLVTALGTSQITIRAVDGYGNQVFTYDNKVAQITENEGKVRAQGICINPVLGGIPPYLSSPPTNYFTFNNGEWTGEILVTKDTGGNTIVLKASEIGNETINGLSVPFRVDHGNFDRIWFELPGEKFTEGYYPGNDNSGFFLPDMWEAGHTMSPFNIYAIDKFWNIVALPEAASVDIVGYGHTDWWDSPQYLTVNGTGTITGVRPRTADNNFYLTGTIESGIYTDWSSESNRFVVYAGTYTNVVILAPAQSLDRGADAPPGREGFVIPERIDQEFTVTCFLTDNFYNRARKVGAWPDMKFSVENAGGPVSEEIITNPSNEFTRAITPDLLGLWTFTLSDANDVLQFDDVTVQVGHGDLHHFTITNVPDKRAGEAFGITITAYDIYNNIADTYTGPVNFALFKNGTRVTVGTPVEPSAITFPLGGTLFIPDMRVYHAGDVMEGYGVDHLTIRVRSDAWDVENFTNEFNIHEQAQDEIVLLLPGERYNPGKNPFKSGNAINQTAGAAIPISITAVDRYGNQVDADSEQITLWLNDPQAYKDFKGPTALAHGSVSKDIFLYTAKYQIVYASMTSTGDADWSDVTVAPSSYDDAGTVLLLAAGETHRPGWPQGKAGLPLPVEAHTEIVLTVLACDEFFNQDTKISAGTISLTSNDGAIDTTAAFANTGEFGKAVIDGQYLRGSETLPVVRVTAQTSVGSSFSDITVIPGAYFAINAPVQVIAGEPFQLDVSLIDPATHVPGNFNHTIYFEAVRQDPDTSPATIALGVQSVNLSSGTITVLNQYYSYVEVVRIKVTDQYKRIAYSHDINVIPNNLVYQVTYPFQATTEEQWNMTIKLYDSKDTQQRYVIKNMDHMVYISPFNSDGIFSGKQVMLEDGVAVIPQTFTKAQENVIFRATGTVSGYNADSYGNQIDIKPGPYFRVQIIAPNEIPVPGIPSETGKDSTNLTTQAGKVGFTIRAYAVDRYWNRIYSIGGTGASRSVRLIASDGSLSGFVPVPFVQGEAIIPNVKLQVPPVVDVTAEDSIGGVFSQTVRINLTGKKFTIVCEPNYPFTSPERFVTGADCDIIVKYVTYSTTGETEIIEPTSFHLVPMDRNLEPLDPSNIIILSPTVPGGDPNQLITSPPTTGGGTRFTLQYKVAEDVIFKAYDDDSWIGYSVDGTTGETIAIHFEPQKIYYEIDMPAEAVVGPPDTFIMKVIPRDINTGTIPKNSSATIRIAVTNVSNPTNQFDGNLLVTEQVVAGGPVEFNQAFTRAGIVTLKVYSIDDETETGEGEIILHAGNLAKFEGDIPKEVEAGTTREIKLSFFDQYDNPIKDMPAVLSLDDDLLNFQLGSLNTMSITSNSLGTSSVRLTALDGFSGQLFFSASVGSFIIHEVISVMGPPVTTLCFGGMARDTFKGHSIKQTDPISIDADYHENLTLEKIMYRIDGGEWQEYTEPFTIEEVGIHTLEYYGVTIGELEHAETSHQSLSIFVTQATEAGEGMVNYPNPFMAGKEPTFLEYHLSVDSSVKLMIYDVMGQKVYERDLGAGAMGGIAGLNRIEWDGKNSDGSVVANGGYIAVLDVQGEGRHMRRKIAVRK